MNTHVLRARLCALFVTLLLSFALPAQPQVTLTGANTFGATPSGATNVSQAYQDGFNNTLGGDQWWNLWMALDPNASSPINGPSDAQASIAIPLQAGHSYKYYVFGSGVPGTGTGFVGWNLFFNGDGSTPGISVFGPLGTAKAWPNASDVLSLQGNPVTGSGVGFYIADGVIVVLTESVWDGLQTPPGNVAQPFEFAPNADGDESSYGSFTLAVFLAANLSIAQPSDPPGAPITLTGTGFGPGETVVIYPNSFAAPLGIATTGPTGTFTTTILVPQHPYGLIDLFALGLRSGKLGGAGLAVSSSLTMLPKRVVPGATTAAEGFGFGDGELVNIYLDQPNVLLATVPANSLGSFAGVSAAQVVVPASAHPGLNALIGVGQTTGAIGIGELIVQ